MSMETVTLDFELEMRTLPNGLRVVAAPDDTLPAVAVNLWYAVGSRDERPGRTGFAHLFEHMMFKGSKHVPDNGHFELIERAGGSLNASTWFDRTNYFETLPSHQLELALWLESDRMGFMLDAMTQRKLDVERDVVKNEKRQRYDNQPYGDWSERLQELVWPEGHPYRHTVIGSMADLDAAELDDIEDFFRTFYLPNNAVLTVAGDADTERIFELAEAWFGDIARGDDPPPVPGRSDVGPVLGETVRTRLVRDVPLPRLLIGCRIPPYTDPRFEAMDLCAQILGQGKGSRLYRSLVREQRLARDASSYAYPLVTGGSMLLVFVTGYPDTDLDGLEEAVFAEMDAMASVADAEVERARTLAAAREVRGLESLAERADVVSMTTTLFNDPHRVNGALERIAAVETEAVRRMAARFLGADNRAVVSYEPSNGGAP
jgi:predicted Zn-dependent peptidase